VASIFDIWHEVAGTYRFMVEIDGMLVAGFSEVSGLTVETEVYEYAEGGVNEYVHRLPARTKHVPLVLKRGISWTDELYNWYLKVIGGDITRKNGAIILFTQDLLPIRRWNFYNAYPTKWVGPELNARNSDIAIETIELTHTGFVAN